MRKVIAALGLAGLLIPGWAGAANIFEKVGTFDGQFLKIAVGARAAAMGGAFVGVADDATFGLLELRRASRASIRTSRRSR